jgi:signal transduction histidine kinase
MDLVLVLVSWRAVVASTWPPSAVAVTCFAALTVNDAWQRVAFGESFAQPAVLYPVLLTALTVGLGLQTRRVRAQNAELLALRDADRLRAVSDERRRIARDLHDVAAHHLSALAVRNGLALRVGTPEGFVEAARFSADTAKEALESMREVVHVLSDDMPAPVTPGPHLADVHDVIARMRAAGLHVEGRWHGPDEHDPVGVPDEIQAVAVRIVQEALSNVLQHRGPGEAWVDVTCDGPVVRVCVEDDGESGTPGGDKGAGRTGRGVTGMRERTEAVGGRLLVGPSRRGGWRVEALLPTHRS